MRYMTVPGIVPIRICGYYYLVTTDETIEINETTLYCWNILSHGADVKDLIVSVCSEYDISDFFVISKDIQNMLGLMLERHLIMRCRS